MPDENAPAQPDDPLDAEPGEHMLGCSLASIPYEYASCGCRGAQPVDVEQIAAMLDALEKRMAKATRGPWSLDMDASVEDGRGKVAVPVIYGGPDSMLHADVLFDMTANEDVLLVEESDGDEFGSWINAHDAQALANAELIVDAFNALPTLTATLRDHLAKIGPPRELFDEMANIVKEIEPMIGDFEEWNTITNARLYDRIDDAIATYDDWTKHADTGNEPQQEHVATEHSKGVTNWILCNCGWGSRIFLDDAKCAMDEWEKHAGPQRGEG